VMLQSGHFSRLATGAAAWRIEPALPQLKVRSPCLANFSLRLGSTAHSCAIDRSTGHGL